MTQKRIYSYFYLSVATQQLPELMGNEAIHFPIGTKAWEGNIYVAIRLSPLKVLEKSSVV